MYTSYDYYRVFYYVARCGSVSQAAKLLINNQPNLTRTIKNLEAELGCALFSRTNRGMKLTPEGEKLYRHVRVAFEHIEAGEAELAASRDMKDGMVSVAASEVALRCLLLPVIREYRRRYPGVRLRISNSSTPQALAALRDGSADIAVVTTPVEVTSALEQRRVRSFRERVICSGEFPELLEGKVDFESLQKYPLVSMAAGTGSFEFYDRLFADKGMKYYPDIEAATADQVLPMVEAGLGAGFVPEEFVRPGDGVEFVELTQEIPPRDICIIKRREQPESVAAKDLERMIIEIGAEMSVDKE